MNKPYFGDNLEIMREMESGVLPSEIRASP